MIFTVDNNNKKISDGQFLLGIKLNLHSDQEITLATPLEKNNTSEDLAAYLKEILITYEDIKGWDDNYLNRWVYVSYRTWRTWDIDCWHGNTLFRITSYF